ncbi:MAG: LSM domain-containing protein [Candidatus Methanomethylophilaceae archaeon]|jgi:small nuclear ribonucleoprotein
MDYGLSGGLRMIKPLAVLQAAANKNVIVELKGKREYRGVLDGYDPHMNVVLKNVEEFQEGKSIRKLNTAIVRGDNVIYISP